MIIFPVFEVKKSLLDLVEVFEIDSEASMWPVLGAWMEAFTNAYEIREPGRSNVACVGWLDEGLY